MTEQEIIDGDWVNNPGYKPCQFNDKVDIFWEDGSFNYNTEAGLYGWNIDEYPSIKYWRFCTKYKEKSKEEFKGLEHAYDSPEEPNLFVYPKTSYKPKSDEELLEMNAAVKCDIIQLVTDTVNTATRKNFSIADIALVKNLLENFKEYEENK